MCIFYQHPSAKVVMDDPRDPHVEDRYALPQPGVSEPVYLQALRGGLPAETCGGCGQPNALHYDTTGVYFVGCHGVPSRRALSAMVKRPLRDVSEWGDPHPAVSSAIRDAFTAGCGQDVAYFYSMLTADERLHLSRRLAEIAVIAYLAEQKR